MHSVTRGGETTRCAGCQREREKGGVRLFKIVHQIVQSPSHPFHAPVSLFFFCLFVYINLFFPFGRFSFENAVFGVQACLSRSVKGKSLLTETHGFIIRLMAFFIQDSV